MKTIAVYCGACSGVDPVYINKASKLGFTLVRNNIKLIYGGARVGCMGAVADAVLEAGGEVIGVIPEKLVNVEVAHKDLIQIDFDGDVLV